jgi:hypothetical protein
LLRRSIIIKTALYSLLLNYFVTKSRIIFVHDLSNIDNEFNNSWYLFLIALILLQVRQFRMYCFTFRFIFDQRWFLRSSLIVLFTFEWSNANWSCISCIKKSRFDSSIIINSIIYSNLSNRSEDNKIWFCCFWQSFFSFDTSSIRLINESAFSLNFSNRYVMTKWKSVKNCAHLLCRRFNCLINMKYSKFLWSINILTEISDWINDNSSLHYSKHRTIVNNSLS